MTTDSITAARGRGIDIRHAPYAALILRVALGAVFVAHAWLRAGWR